MRESREQRIRPDNADRTAPLRPLAPPTEIPRRSRTGFGCPTTQRAVAVRGRGDALYLPIPARLMGSSTSATREFGRLCERFEVPAKAMGRRLRQVIPVRGQAAGEE